jgi:two-component system CheB/CheR fusion protein
MVKKKARPSGRRKGANPGRSTTSTPSASLPSGAHAASFVPETAEPAAHQPPPTVVGIGASAGGLEAFSQILDSLEASPDVAFVVIQHLSPQHDSALAMLLSARTSLSVIQATDDLPIETNRVYVIPPNVHMEIVNGSLNLLPRPHDRTQFNPIDFFFESLAHWGHERAIAVVLSGTASDGALGIAEIKAMGGITIVQKPETAKYDGMPKAAIATGQVDLVLSPKEIAEHINHLREHPYLVRKHAAEPRDNSEATDEQLQDVFGILRRASGIDFQHYKLPTVRRRLLRRMALHRLAEVSAYIRYIRDHPPEVTALCQDLLIHVTRFFRDPESFSALKASALAEIVAQKPDDPIRVWVAGCSTGEESYSVAIVLMEMLVDRIAERKVQIFGTDVSESAIDVARSGTYPATIAADVSPERLKRFFTKSDGGYRVSKVLRDVCIFARHDLARDAPFSRLDLIVCRNVLIYLDAALQKRVISVFQYALKTHGHLMLGAAETAGPHSAFTPIDKKWRIYRKAPEDVVAALAFPSGRVPNIEVARRSIPAFARPEGRPVQEEANRIVLDKYGPPGVVVDANFEIVHFRGRTGPYLEAASGEPNLHVLKMARGGLLHPLRSALSTARQKHRTVRKADILVQHNGDWRPVNIEVVPLVTARGEHFLILFETPHPVSKGRNAKVSGTRSSGAAADATALSDLRRELAANRQYLQSIIQELETANEELQSANEEILSSNEELQSTNEELDTAKEELQSTNEELNTLNEELHGRNEELARVNSDLVNLLGSADLPIVIIGQDMSIRRFTPAAERLFSIIAADLGRRIGQIRTNLVCDNLEELVRSATDGLDTQEYELQDRKGRWYLLRIRPYKAHDNRLDGAVITAIDIDDAKRLQHQLERSRDYFMAVVETVSQPLLVLDANLQVRTANKSFYQHFPSIAGAEGAPIYQFANGQWDIPELRTILAAAASGQATHHLRVEHLASKTSKGAAITARGFELPNGEHWILIAMDINAKESH